MNTNFSNFWGCQQSLPSDGASGEQSLVCRSSSRVKKKPETNKNTPSTCSNATAAIAQTTERLEPILPDHQATQAEAVF